MCLQCGYCSAGTPWTLMSVAISLQGHLLVWAPYPAPAVAPDPEEELETTGPEDLLNWAVLQARTPRDCSASPAKLWLTEAGLFLLPVPSGTWEGTANEVTGGLSSASV